MTKISKHWTPENTKFLVKMIEDTPGSFAERLKAAAQHFNKTVSSVYCKYRHAKKIHSTRQKEREKTIATPTKRMGRTKRMPSRILSIDIKNIKIDLVNSKLIIFY
jgi:hypothetical protein